MMRFACHVDVVTYTPHIAVYTYTAIVEIILWQLLLCKSADINWISGVQLTVLHSYGIPRSQHFLGWITNIMIWIQFLFSWKLKQGQCVHYATILPSALSTIPPHEHIVYSLIIKEYICRLWYAFMNDLYKYICTDPTFTSDLIIKEYVARTLDTLII